MNILLGCEESQATTIELRKMGHNAFSCDLQECSGGHPEWHIVEDVREVISTIKFYTQDRRAHFVSNWDLIILHPPCTYTALSGNRWYYNSTQREEGAEFCKEVWNLACSVCDKVALEQPKTIMQKYIGPKSQVIHPWQFGHAETKETWLWLKGLPLLSPTNIVEGRESRIHRMPPGIDRRKERSKTYPGIARAIAEQWGQTLTPAQAD